MTEPMKGKDSYLKYQGTVVAKITSIDGGPGFDVADTTGIGQDDHTEVKTLRNESYTVNGQLIDGDDTHVALYAAACSDTATVSGLVWYKNDNNYLTFPATTILKDWSDGGADPSGVLTFSFVIVPNGEVTRTVAA